MVKGYESLGKVHAKLAPILTRAFRRQRLPYGRIYKCAHRKNIVIIRYRVYITVLDYLRRKLDYFINIRIILYYRYNS